MVVYLPEQRACSSISTCSNTYHTEATDECSSSKCSSYDSLDDRHHSLTQQLEARRKETKNALEQSWKEAESLKKECSAKFKTIILLQIKIEASKARKCAAIERMARLNLRRIAYHNDEKRSMICCKDSKGERKTSSLSACHFREMIFSLRTTKKQDKNRCEETKRIAENHLKMSSRDQTILAMKDALEESRATIKTLREKRWSKVRNRLSSIEIPCCDDGFYVSKYDVETLWKVPVVINTYFNY